MEGKLTIAVDSHNNYDHWTDADRAPQLRRTHPATVSFIIETRLSLIDPVPVAGSRFHVGLELVFDQFEVYNFGLSSSTAVSLRRTGGPPALTVPYSDPSVSLRIEKQGSILNFSYRAQDSDPWIGLANNTRVTEPIGQVGFMLKTWEGVSVTADFDYFSIDLLERGIGRLHRIPVVPA